MLCFMDCEFTGLHKNTTLVSIGMVTSTGKQLYAEFTDYDESQVDDWIRDNVIAKLWKDEKIPKHVTYMHANREWIANGIRDWIDALAQPKIVMVCDVLAWDWVLFCDLFGGAFNIPSSIHYIPLDLATMFWMKALDPDTPREKYAWVDGDNHSHNALSDAGIIRACHKRLTVGDRGRFV